MIEKDILQLNKLKDVFLCLSQQREISILLFLTFAVSKKHCTIFHIPIVSPRESTHTIRFCSALPMTCIAVGCAGQ